MRTAFPLSSSSLSVLAPLFAFASLASLGALGCASSTSSGASSGSSGSGSGEALFEAGESEVTPDLIYGTWGGVLEDGQFRFDSRMKLSRGEISFATRCELPDGRESAVASVTAKARITDDEIAVLESKKHEVAMNGGTCRAFARPSTTSRCTQRDGFERDCFRMEGTRLVIFSASPFDKLELTKLSD